MFGQHRNAQPGIPCHHDGMKSTTSSLAPGAKLQGVLSPVLTPFTPDLTPDTKRFVTHCRWLLEQGVGLAMFGTNSEGNSLSVTEKCRLLDALIGADIPLHGSMPGTGSCNLPDAVALTCACLAAGCGGVLVLPPFYYKNPPEDGLFRFFAELVERVGDRRLRVYLYHIPPVASVGISPSLVERLLKSYPGVIAGMKDTGGDWAFTKSMIEHFGPEGFDVFAGTETILLDTLRNGGAGCIAATANVNPARIVELFQNWQTPQAPEMQAGLNRTRSLFAAQPMIAAMKAALAHFTADDGWKTVRPPLVPLAPDASQTLIASLLEAGFSMPDLQRYQAGDSAKETK